MFRIDARSIQAALASEGAYLGGLDGLLGPRSKAAVATAFTTHFKTAKPWSGWAWERRLLAYEQLMMLRNDIEAGEIDGLMGPQTRYAFEVWQNKLRDSTPTEAQIAHMPTSWPRQSDVPSYYGDKGQNQVLLALPYPMFLAWDKSKIVRSISLHEKVAESAGRAFSAILGAYGPADIKRLRLDQFGGSLNVRKMRGGSAWSMHSWGIAIDIDPEHNQFRWGRDQAALDNDAYAPFWRAWEAEGWVSLGRERNFDWQHFQAARL